MLQVSPTEKTRLSPFQSGFLSPPTVRRVWRALNNAGLIVGREHVARLMRAHGLQGVPRRKFVVTTESKHSHPTYENLLNRDFAASAPDRVWTADITYLPTQQGWLYLAVIIDLFSRRVVGWSMSTQIDQQLTLAALRMAVARRQPASGWLHHSDRGSQYAAGAYQRSLSAHGAAVSMSRKGDCWDNAPTESFFASLKKEAIHAHRFATREQARIAVLNYLRWYNAHRIHSALGYMPPNKFEANAATEVCQAA